MIEHWVFGYGSLIWRPDFPFLERKPARLAGYARRFWQGSHDHRGLPDAPGRVVTLVPDLQSHCDGLAYRVSDDVLEATLAKLDHREQNGYERLDVQLSFRCGRAVSGLVYQAGTNNHAYLGPAPLPVIAEQIDSCAGPSGTNREYLFELARALRELDMHDDHVFALEALVPSGP